MENKKNNSIALVGSTYFPKWYKGKLKSLVHTDKIRGDIALQTMLKAKELGIWAVVCDGGSTKTFLKELSLTNNPKLKVIRLATSKRSPNKRRAIFTAAQNPDVKVIILTELEKLSLIADCLSKIVNPILEGNADVVIPRREDALFKKSYPLYMYDSEVEGNTLYNEELRSHELWGMNEDDLDVFFGPRVFRNNRELLLSLFRMYRAKRVKSLLHQFVFDLEEYSNAQFFPVVQALKKGKKVVGVTIPFEYPRLQKENELKGNLDYFIEKRKFQKLTIIVELMHFMGYLDHKRKTRITLPKTSG